MKKLYVGITELVQPHSREGGGKEPLDVTEDAALLVADGVVLAAGPREAVRGGPAEVIDLGGRAVVPGFVDSHTHVVFAGDRMDEMSRRCRGETYEEIARAGGGIARSASLLASATEEELVASARARLLKMHARGTTTCEVKTGYGLLPAEEKKQLAAILALAKTTSVAVLPTLLMHVVPPSFRGRRAEYIETFCRELLTEENARDVRFCDVFVDDNAFTPSETRVLAERAHELQLGLRLHVDQLRDGDGAALAVELGAISADHLEHTNEAGMAALANAGVVATVLPGCRLFLGKGPWPRARALRDAGCEVAIATDLNPGSSFVHDLALCATLAATQCGLTLEEALWGITRGGARALGLDDRGCLRAGERADFVVVDHADWRALLYQPGEAPIFKVVSAGR